VTSHSLSNIATTTRHGEQVDDRQGCAETERHPSVGVITLNDIKATIPRGEGWRICRAAV
jgi:hypothetical protein